MIYIYVGFGLNIHDIGEVCVRKDWDGVTISYGAFNLLLMWSETIPDWTSRS